MNELELPKLVPQDDPILHEVMPEFDFANPSEDIGQVYQKLAKAMLTYGGIGLSANQVGIRVRAYVMRSDPVLCLVNPKIVHASEETGMFKEGCLSFPALMLSVRRAKAVRVRFSTPDGKTQTQQFAGLTAACAQHEIDHLNGITFQSHVKPLALQLALKKQKDRIRLANRGPKRR